MVGCFAERKEKKRKEKGKRKKNLISSPFIFSNDFVPSAVSFAPQVLVSDSLASDIACVKKTYYTCLW